MSGVLVIAAWCFLQVESRHPEIITSNSNHGNFLDNDKWLSTVSQYDRDKYWNKFRDVSTSSFTACFLSFPFERSIISTGGCWLLEAVGRGLRLGQPFAACMKDVQSYLETKRSRLPHGQGQFGLLSVSLRAYVLQFSFEEEL
ncbi:PREDICTED: testican-3-like [Nestor notabilis]|uniref:testican-3-like n=1 Tax=Nestor notabilis TaxID=176057 RepID=UPI000523EDD7|nr:PREDICTED: testican-3-like [Nestor notabilis]